MDELEISGKRYISTRRAAKEHKYHADYIGQLVRGKKVVGQKVGRSWYVSEESLNAYFEGEKSPVVQVAAIPQAKVEVPAAVPEVIVQPMPESVEEVLEEQ